MMLGVSMHLCIVFVAEPVCTYVAAHKRFKMSTKRLDFVLLFPNICNRSSNQLTCSAA